MVYVARDRRADRRCFALARDFLPGCHRPEAARLERMDTRRHLAVVGWGVVVAFMLGAISQPWRSV